MTELSTKWKQIFDEISTANEHFEVGEINYYNLASILEDLYVENAELKERIEALEKSRTGIYKDLANSMKQAARETFGND